MSDRGSRADMNNHILQYVEITFKGLAQATNNMDRTQINIYVPYRADTDLATTYPSSIDCFVKNNSDRRDVAFVYTPHDADLIILFEEFSFKLPSYKKRLMTSPLIQEFADRIYTVNCDDIGQGFLPGCYTSLRVGNFERYIHRACAYPYIYNDRIPGKVNHQIDTRLLFSFRGTSFSHPVRKRIISLLGGYHNGSVKEINQQFHSHDNEQKDSYIKEILESKFVLCPRGWSPSTYRLFEVMQLGRCPVIISDEWMPIDDIPWDECSIRISEREISKIPSILESRLSEAEDLGNCASEIWSKHFSDQAKFRAYLDMIIDIKTSCEALRSKCNVDLKAQIKRWNSWSYNWNNGWTLPQRIFRRIKMPSSMLF